MRGRRLMAGGAAFMLAGGALLLLPGVSSADEGTDFGSFSLSARAPAVDVLVDDQTNAPSHPALQGVFPEAISTLQPGPIARGFSSIVWPGPLVGNIGSAAVTGGAPPDAEKLNSPIRAEAQSTGPRDAKFDQIPGAVMTAHAEDALATATGTLQGGGLPGVATLGSATGTSTVTLKGGKAVSESVSKLTDVAVGPDGVVKIASIVSIARATSDAKAGASEGNTVVSGVTIAGQAATIDDQGVHFGEQKQANPLADVVNEAGKQALQAAGMTITVTKPQLSTKDAQGDAVAGTVVFSWSTGQGQTFAVALGGASASAVAAPGFGSDVLGDVTGDAGNLGAVTPDGAALGDVGSGGGVDLGSPSVPSGNVSGAPAPAGANGASPAVAVDTATIGHFKGTAPALILLAVGAALFAAGSMRRLPDHVLRPSDTACNLGDDQ